MGKKRKAIKPAQTSEPGDFDPAESRLGPVNTYEDIADSEEEYFINQDKILLEEEPRSKRQKRIEEEDALLEFSDEEVLAHDDPDDEGSDGGLDAAALRRASKLVKRSTADSDDEGKDTAREEDPGWWGPSKKEYYDGDFIETQEDALEEEAEAKRLQRKKLTKMAEEDFIESEWLDSKDSVEEGVVVTEVLKDLDIPNDMGSEDRYQLLTSRYPEFEFLAAEFQDLEPKLATQQKEVEGKPVGSLEVVKYWVLASYVAALACYFALLTSPAMDEKGCRKTLDPATLRDHEVMETLVNCREMWQKAAQLETSATDPVAITEAEALLDDLEDLPHALSMKEPKSQEKRSKKTAPVSKEVEESLADLYNLPISQTKSRKKPSTEETKNEAKHSDFGEEETLDARTAADKDQRKKSLRFYTSQIVQKASRRVDAGRDAGGDTDIPYKERLRDRQARLNAEAERRGKKNSKFGADLDANEDTDDEDAATAVAIRDEGNEYYDMVASSSRQKKTEKAEKFAAYAAASKLDRVVEKEEVGEDGKRKVTYAIEKNKGLAPKRKKIDRNPRVKKRKRYDDKMKKLRSMKPVYRQPDGPYSGVKTGIKAGLIRSTKL